jgi:hypothetical protein
VTTTDTTPTVAWLDEAEAMLAAEEAAAVRGDEEFAAGCAEMINEHLERLGITPVTPAHSDGKGRVVPALLTPLDADRKFYGVHATFDEEEGVQLHVEDYRPTVQGGFYGLHLAVEHLVGVRNVVYARRHGPRPAPAVKPQPSLDAQHIAAALDRLTAAVDSVARNVSRP